jgi:hypothetical protein
VDAGVVAEVDGGEGGLEEREDGGGDAVSFTGERQDAAMV